MDWYPLWNSLRIALISCTAVFFLGIFAAYYIAKLPRTVMGIFFLEHFGVKLVMNWYSAIFASIVVAFPLMYRTARGAFESFDETLAWSAQTLGQSNAWIFWRVRMPCPGRGRVRCYQHDSGLHPGQDGHHRHHGVPALAHQR